MVLLPVPIQHSSGCPWRTDLVQFFFVTFACSCLESLSPIRAAAKDSPAALHPLARSRSSAFIRGSLFARFVLSAAFSQH